MHKTSSVFAIALLGVVGTEALAQDFYVAGIDSRIYSVDFSTLLATEIFQIETTGIGGNVTEILYTGGDTMLVNVPGQLIQYNMVTGSETTILNLRDQYGSGIQFSDAIIRTSDDRIGMSVYEVHDVGGASVYSAYDPFTQEYEVLTTVTATPALLDDLYELDSNHMVGLRGPGRRAVVFDLNDGSSVEEYLFDFHPSAFLEYQDDLFILDRDFNLHLFDPMSGDAQFYGHIGGTIGQSIGATSNVAFRIPAPGVPMALGLGGLLVTRRRRD